MRSQEIERSRRFIIQEPSWCFACCLTSCGHVKFHESLLVGRLRRKWNVIEKEGREDEFPPSVVGAPAQDVPFRDGLLLCDGPANS